MKTLLKTSMSPASVKFCLFKEDMVLNKEISNNFNIVTSLNEISALSKLVGILLLNWVGTVEDRAGKSCLKDFVLKLLLADF